MRRLSPRPDRTARHRPDFVLYAAALLAIAEVVVAAASGRSPAAPFRFAASVVLGSRAFGGVPGGVAIAIGAIVAIVIASFWGAAYGALAARLPRPAQTSRATQAGAGVLFGALVYLVDYQILARLAWPWFLEPSQPLQLFLHMGFFGLPLGLFFLELEKEAPVAR